MVCGAHESCNRGRGAGVARAQVFVERVDGEHVALDEVGVAHLVVKRHEMAPLQPARGMVRRVSAQAARTDAEEEEEKEKKKQKKKNQAHPCRSPAVSRREIRRIFLLMACFSCKKGTPPLLFESVDSIGSICSLPRAQFFQMWSGRRVVARRHSVSWGRLPQLRALGSGGPGSGHHHVPAPEAPPAAEVPPAVVPISSARSYLELGERRSA